MNALTEDVRARGLVAARAARLAKAQERAANYTVTNWEDRDERWWKNLAKEQGVALPPRGTSLDAVQMGKYLRKLGLTQRQYEDWTGQSLKDFIRNNEDWSLRAWLGLVLERPKE